MVSSDSYQQRVYEKYYNKSKNTNYVSFDIFDTLMKRNVLSNCDVFKLTELIYEKKYGKRISGFAEKREKVEQKLWKHTKEGQFTFDNIYHQLETWYSKNTLDKLKKIELRIEKEILERNSKIDLIWNDAIQKKHVILISDMYFSSEYMKEVLYNFGFIKYESLFVSGEQNALKADGSLFRKIKKQSNIKTILHIGDSLRGDFLNAKKNGFDSILFKNHPIKYFDYSSVANLADSIAAALANNGYWPLGNYWERIGFSILGPLLVAFSQWLDEEILKDSIESVVFFARDGYILKKAFDELSHSGVPSRYMYISRKSVQIPLLAEKTTIHDMICEFKFRQSESVANVLKRMGVQGQNDLGKKSIELKREELYEGKYDELLLSYREKILLNARNQKQALKEYCKTVFTEKRVAVVDVGWHGTCQTGLRQILGNNVTIMGYYLGLENEADLLKQAFFKKKDGFNKNMIPLIRGIIETFFSAPHPSTAGYRLNNDKSVEIIYEDNNGDAETLHKIQLLHQGAMQFVYRYKEISSTLEIDDIHLSHKFAVSALLNLALNPNKMEVDQFGEIEFSDTTNRKLIKGTWRDPYQCLKSFMDSDWKAGFIRKCFKIDLPFGVLLMYLNGFRKKS